MLAQKPPAALGSSRIALGHACCRRFACPWDSSHTLGRKLPETRRSI